jgi:hypothetical protein
VLHLVCTDVYGGTALLFELFLCFALAMFTIEMMQKRTSISRSVTVATEITHLLQGEMWGVLP